MKTICAKLLEASLESPSLLRSVSLRMLLKSFCNLDGSEIRINNMYDLIQNVSLPQWVDWIQKKTSLEPEVAKVPRKDALWKRVLRDIRDFYRIIFRSRFYSYNFRNRHHRRKWLKVFLNELGLPLPTKSSEYSPLFTFVHQTHKADKGMSGRREDSTKNPFWGIDHYNMKTKLALVTHPITSQMILYVVKNFGDTLVGLANQGYRSEYKECIDDLLTICQH